MGTSEGQIARLDEKVISLSRAHSELRERFDELEDIVMTHTQILDHHKVSHDKINDMHQTFTQVQAGFVVIGWLGKGFKFLWPIVALGVAVSIYVKTGVWSYKP
jgi:hypothetical protein